MCQRLLKCLISIVVDHADCMKFKLCSQTPVSARKQNISQDLIGLFIRGPGIYSIECFDSPAQIMLGNNETYALYIRNNSVEEWKSAVEIKVRKFLKVMKYNISQNHIQYTKK